MGRQHFSHSLLSLLLLLLPHTASPMLYYPTPQLSLLEHHLVDNWGAYASNFSSAITPCTNYVTEVGLPSLNSGRTTAAQWLRVAFHDFVTANASAGTGGIDASIGFETLRAENSGSAFNDSFTFWRPFASDAVAMADLLALGTVLSVGLCGGGKIPFRPGRTDAAAADPTTGVPAPETDLDTTLGYFARAGFGTVADAVGLTACGHTLGSVHHGGFPDVVPLSVVMANNTNGGVPFDATRGAFDDRVVREYVEWTGQRGGPLVTTDNATTRSDLRLYEADGNATMWELYGLGTTGFQETCVGLLGRLVDTVSSGVVLQPAIEAIPVKPLNVSLDFADDGSLVLTGSIRVLDVSLASSNSSTAPPWLEFCFSGRCTRSLPESETGQSGYFDATTTYFPLAMNATGLTPASSFSVAGPGIPTHGFPVAAGTFVVPSLTAVHGTVVNATIAKRVWTGGLVTAQVAAPVGQAGTLGPKIVTVELVVTELGETRAGYALWQGMVDVGQVLTGAVTVKVFVDDEVADVLMLGAGVAGW